MRTVRMGVLVGHRRAGRLMFGSQDGFFRELCRAGRREGVTVFAFSPADIHWAKGTVTGFVPGRRRAWAARAFPLPHVVYDRAFRKGPAYRAARRRLRARGARFINAIVGHKWRVHRWLRADPEVAPHLPESAPATAPARVARMVRRHGDVYVKPINGAKGRGILRVVREGRRFRIMRARRGGRTAVARAGSLRGRRVAGPALMVQQAIDVVRVGGRRADLRLVVQKDGGGRWQVTGGAMRIGRPGAITTNLHARGRGVPIADGLAAAFPGEPERVRAIHDTVWWLGVRVAAAVERRCGPLGELGVDLAVDRQGRVWFLEVNPKLARVIFFHLREPAGRREAVANPVRYARWLVTRGWRRRGERAAGGSDGAVEAGAPRGDAERAAS